MGRGVDDATYRLLVDSVRDYAIFLLDADGYIRSWNKGAERIKGYRASEIIGRHFSVFYPQERIDEGWPDARTVGGPQRGTLRGRGLAPAQGRIAILGECRASPASITPMATFAVSPRSPATSPIVAAYRALEDEGRKLTTFLAMLGHELRNPLAPIANAVAIMQSEAIESESLRFCRDVIGRQVAQMTRLVDDLLDVSRITSGKINLERSVFDLRAVLAHAMETDRARSAAPRARAGYQGHRRAAWVCGDRARLLQVFSNLLSNAVKFTPPGGTITATLRRDGGQIEVSIRDNGPGIPADRLEDVFGLFVQGAPHSAQAPGGLGLGLSLVQQLRRIA